MVLRLDQQKPQACGTMLLVDVLAQKQICMTVPEALLVSLAQEQALLVFAVTQTLQVRLKQCQHNQIYMHILLVINVTWTCIYT